MSRRGLELVVSRFTLSGLATMTRYISGSAPKGTNLAWVRLWSASFQSCVHHHNYRIYLDGEHSMLTVSDDSKLW